MRRVRRSADPCTVDDDDGEAAKDDYDDISDKREAGGLEAYDRHNDEYRSGGLDEEWEAVRANTMRMRTPR